MEDYIAAIIPGMMVFIGNQIFCRPALIICMLSNAVLFCVPYICWGHKVQYIDGLVQDCSNYIANALELLQSCTKPSISNNKLHGLVVHIL